MKLTDLAIEGLNIGEKFQINRMHHGLNVVYESTNDERDCVTRLIRYTLFGTSLGKHTNSSSSPAPTGYADVARGPYRFRLTRNTASQHALQVQGLDNASQIYSGDDLFGKIDAAVFDALYDVDFEQLDRHLSDSAIVLTNRLGVGAGSSRWPNEAAYLAWKREAESQRLRLDHYRSEWQQLDSEKSRLLLQIDAATARESNERQQLDRAIAEIETRLSEVQSNVARLQNELTALDSRIHCSQLEIDRREMEIEFVPVGACFDSLEVLYGQLDLIDGQIARWRGLQNEVQQQRIKLRDEIEAWSEIELDAQDHPYYLANQALQRANSLVANVELASLKVDSENLGERVPVRQITNDIRTSSEKLRGELNLVCDELAAQFRQLRHTTAAATMKHLREQFSAMAENLSWLLAERTRTIEEIRQVDSIGADAILLAQPEFCQLAEREGLLAARRRFHGNPPIANGDHRAIKPDLSVDRNQLNQHMLQRGELLESIALREAQLQELNVRLGDMMVRRDRCYFAELIGMRERLNQVQNLMAAKAIETETLSQTVEANERVPAYTPNPILAQASQFLSRLTEGQFVGLSVAATGATVLVSDRVGQTREVTATDQPTQHATLLSICLAANWWLNQQGLAVPMMFREVLPANDLPRATLIATILREFGLAGHQILAFTRNHQVTEMISQRLIAGTYSLYRTARPVSLVGTLPPITRDVINHFAAAAEPAPMAGLNIPRTPPTLQLPPAPSGQRPAESSWQRQAVQAFPNAASRPVVYSDRSDFRTFPIYRPPIASTSSETDRMPTEPAIAGSIRPVLNRAPVQLTEGTPLRSVDLADSIHVANLMGAGVATIVDLLAIDPNDLSPQLARMGFSADQLDRWQAQAWLMLCIAGLTPSDSRVLVACGIMEPEQFETTSAEQLLGRVKRYLNSPDGRRFAPDDSRYQMDRINAWHRALQDSRSRWRIGNGYSRRMRRSGGSSAVASDQDSSEPAMGTSQSGYFSRERNVDHRPGSDYFASRQGANTASSDHGQEFEVETELDRPVARTTEVPNSNPGEKFFLNLSDVVEAAPSIGPRTAERFTVIGVRTIADFLRVTAESMAEKIQYKRISADVIRQWQQQARLVCRIPNLRGHDAQLLVACGITEAEQLSGLQPKKLLDLVGPYSETKEGLKIIRAGTKPDLQEVTNWIAWAKQTRSLQAA